MARLIWLAESLFSFCLWVSSSWKRCFFRPSWPLSCHFDIGWFGISWRDREARTYCLKNYFSLWPCFYVVWVILCQYQSYLASMCFDFFWDWMHLLQLYFTPRCFCEFLVKFLVLRRCVIFEWTFGSCLVITFVTVILYSEMLWHCVSF